MQYDIFVSYKRRGVSSVIASILYELLLHKGYDVFLDRKEMRSGKFNEQLLEHIDQATDIIILLEEGSLDSWSQNKDKDEYKKPGAQPPYKSDWFCKEIMHALSLPGKNIVPILLDGYKMPASEDLPDEMKDLSFHNALTLEDGEVEMLFQKYLIGKEYLRSKPKNLALSRISASNDTVVGSFLICSDVKNFGVYEYGERIITLTDMNDIDHPFRYPVSFAGEHQFLFVNYDTGEEVRITKRIEANCQEYIFVKWTWTEELWELTEAKIKEQNDLSTLVSWGDILIKGNEVHEPNANLSYQCMTRAIELMGEDLEVVSIHGPQIAEILCRVADENFLGIRQDEAIGLYRKLSNINPDRYLPKLARCLSSYPLHRGVYCDENTAREKYDESLSILKQLAEKDPKCYFEIADVLVNYGKVLLFHGKFESAEKRWAKAIGFCKQMENVDYDKCWTSVAMIYYEIAKYYTGYQVYKSAEDEYVKAIDVCCEKLNMPQHLPLKARIIRGLAEIHLVENNIDESTKESLEIISIYKHLSEKNPKLYRPELALAFNLLAKGNLCQKKYEMAEKSYKEAIEIYRSLPDGERYAYYMAEAKNELSYCYLNQDRVEQALKTIDEAIQLRPKDPNYLDSKGEFLLAMDRKEEALDAYHQIIQVEENYYQKNETDFYKGLKERGLVE